MAKKKKLPEWATTVTPLSKTIALILFILLPFVGFYFGMKYQKALDTVSRPTIEFITSGKPMPSVVPHELNR